jgi:large subunit ribosomal protein L31
VKKEIHPVYQDVVIGCVCGAEWKTRSTAINTKRIDICSNCHPFYTGKQKVLDTEGRIEKFRKKYAANTTKK